MAGLGNTFENDLWKLIFNATAIANIADNAAASPLTNLFVALHTADPGEAGDQTTSEATYTGYARVSVARTSGGFTIANNVMTNAAAITFPQCTGGANTITHWSVGVATSGASKILAFGPVGNITNCGEFTSTTADVITVPQVTLIVDDRVSFYPTPAAVLPTGMTEGTVYFVKTVSGNDITIATTSGGATIDLTTTGAGLIYKHGLLAVSNLITPSFAIGALSAKLD
jgi:hypothetical protein